jgi:hypothetical protein
LTGFEALPIVGIEDDDDGASLALDPGHLNFKLGFKCVESESDLSGLAVLNIFPSGSSGEELMLVEELLNEGYSD